MEEKEKIWNQAIIDLRKTFREDRKREHLFNHLVAFFQTLKEGSWELEEVSAAGKKREVVGVFYVNWIGGKTSNKAKRYLQRVEMEWTSAIAYVWGTFKTADVESRPVTPSVTEEAEEEEEDVDLIELEQFRKEHEQSERERLRRLEALEASGIISDDQRRWLTELREKFTK